jgi:hypothetical protein
MHHGGFVNDEHIHIEGRRRVVAQTPRSGARAQQRVQGARRTDACSKRAQIKGVADACLQPCQRRLQRLAQARRRLACGCGQRDAQALRCAVHREQRSQQARGGIGLPGARPAGDDGQARAQGDGAGEFLPIAAASRQRIEQTVQPTTHPFFVDIERWRSARAQALRHLLLETPVAPQVEQGRSRRAGQYQRGAGIGRVYRLGRLHAAAGAHGGQPVCAARREALHQHRQGFLPRSAPAGEVQQALAQTAQRQAAMSLALEMREQRAGHQQLGRRFGVALGDELRQRPIELAQQARIGQGAQAAEHSRALIRGARHGAHACAAGAAATSLPCSSASSASISARGGPSAITPAPGASMPRRKKKSAPPRSRSGA